MQLIRQLWLVGYDGNMHWPSTQVMETLNITSALSASHPAASSLWFWADSADIAAATTMPPPPAKRVKETSGHAG